MRRLIIGVVALALLLDGFLSPTHAGFMTIAYPGANNSYANGIANDGTVVGNANGGISALTYTWTPSQGFNVFSPGTEAYGINTSGQIVGIFAGGSFLRDALGNYTQITIGAYSTTAIGINNMGRIVGAAQDSFSGPQFAFVREISGAFSSFQVPGSPSTEAHGINSSGQIVGYYSSSGGRSQGFLRDANGDITTIMFPGAQQTSLFGINDAGAIVGSADNLPFYRSPTGEYYLLHLPGEGYALGINDADQIVGRYGGPLGQLGFVSDLNTLISLPEPTTITLLAIGIAGIAGYGWRRRKAATV
jgi:uncharacterized membrane protein